MASKPAPCSGKIKAFLRGKCPLLSVLVNQYGAIKARSPPAILFSSPAPDVIYFIQVISDNYNPPINE
jgi:hypothetical protein